MNYGFCFMGNRYDSYAVKLKMKLNLQEELFIPHMVDFKGSDFT